MSFKTVFKRYELKYMLTVQQKEKILFEISKYMKPDKYGRTTIRNIYFDTDDYLLIRRSIEKPIYKEKLRVRSYSESRPNSMVFVELKKKYKHIVYKRRISLSLQDATQWLVNRKNLNIDTQISNEIDYFLDYYKNLHPTLFLSYEREAYFSIDNSKLRVTFDENILCRQNDLSLSSKIYGTPILPQNIVLMEIKCSGSIPLWLTRLLSEEKIYKQSFSKYGTAYKTMIFPKIFENNFVKEATYNAK